VERAVVSTNDVVTVASDLAAGRTASFVGIAPG
jgi:hypothetical protein